MTPCTTTRDKASGVCVVLDTAKLILSPSASDDTSKQILACNHAKLKLVNTVNIILAKNQHVSVVTVNILAH